MTENLEALRKFCKSDEQKRTLEAVIQHGSNRQASFVLGIGRRAVDMTMQRIKANADKEPPILQFTAPPHGDETIDDNVFLISLSKNNKYMEEVIEFSEKEDLNNPHVGKYGVFTKDKKMFDPWSSMHQFIISTVLPLYFTIDGELYSKEKFLIELKSKNNALLLEELFIMQDLYDLGFSGFHSSDRGYRLYNIFEPSKNLTFIEKQPFIIE
jgi:hypothetical protein